MEKLNEMSKREVKNGVIIKAMARKMMNDERSEAFDFPLREEVDNVKLENCLSGNRFTEKLVCFCLYYKTSYDLKIRKIENLQEILKFSCYIFSEMSFTKP